MIRSISSIAPAAHSPVLQSTLKHSAQTPGAELDRVSTGNATFLRAEVLREPEVRAEVVARARALAADPSYPPMAVLRDVAGQILRAPDLSEDLS